MATTFEVIYLGTAADIDPTEGNAIAGNASSLVGTKFGTASDPLYTQVHDFAPVNYSGGDATLFDTDNNVTNDTFSIDGGAARVYDSVAQYDATVTYIDGTTGTISAVVMQDTAGRLYLMPEMTNNADVAVLNAAPIRSLTLNSVLVNDSNMAADRFDMHFMNPVDGTAGADSMGVGYTDANGDKITSNGDLVYAGAGNDTIDGGAGNDTIQGGAGNDLIIGGTGNDLLIGGYGNDTFSFASGWGNDTILGDQGDGADDGGKDMLDFSGLASGVSVTFTGSEDGTAVSGSDSLTFDNIEAVRGGSGNDTINAAADSSGLTLSGGGGADSITGGSGADTISGGTGNDTLSGGTGSDTFLFYGGDGTDIVQGGEDPDNSDTDVLDFSNANQGFRVTFSGPEAGTFSSTSADSAGSFTQIERIVGSNYADSLDASADTSGIELSGGDGADTLIGGSGADLLSGGSGDDRQSGGAGNDTLSGGAGNDTFVLSDGGGADIVTDFDMTLVGGFTVDQLDVSDLTDAEGNPVNAWDVTVSDVGGNALLTFPDGSSVLLNGVAPASVTTAPQLYSIGIPCFVAGTMIDTPSGPRAVETFRIGDEVLTADGRPVVVIWAGGKSFKTADLQAYERLKPVVFRPRSIGNTQELRLSRQHRIAVETPEGPRLVAAGVLVKAERFGARIARGCRKVSYHHLLLSRHALIRAQGAIVESLWPGPEAVKALGPETCRDILLSCPQLAPAFAGELAAERIFGPQVLPTLRFNELRRVNVRPCGPGRLISLEKGSFDGL